MKRYIALKKGTFKGASLKDEVFRIVQAAGETGATRRDIANQMNLNVGRVSSYLADLKREGLVRPLDGTIDVSSLSPEEASLYALTILEGALVANATKNGITKEMEVGFARYQKVKALALGEGTTKHEARSALRFSLIELVKLVY